MFTPRTRDEDGDGHRAYLLGTRLGEAGACGDDCDDTSSTAYPGGVERCDGVDNDCNGIIDDNAVFTYPSEPVRISTSSDNEALPVSIAYAGEAFAVTTIQREERWHGFFQSVSANGDSVITPTRLTLESSDGMAGPLVWTGAFFATAWEDRRERSYDIYFNRLDLSGNKLGPDVRVTNDEGFSVSPSLIWDGEAFSLTYCEETNTGSFRVFTRRLNTDGSVIGAPVAVSGPFEDARGPVLLRTNQGLSLYYNVVGDGYYLQRLDAALTPIVAPVRLPLTDPGEVSVRWNGDRYLVAWSQKSAESVGNAIWAATLDDQGQVIDGPRALVGGRSLARSPVWVALGDRAFLVWADDFFKAGVFELNGEMYSNELMALGSRVRLTNLSTDTFEPHAVIGGSSIGVVFRSRVTGVWQTFFLRLGCEESH
jgi:hypothetical protein